MIGWLKVLGTAALTVAGSAALALPSPQFSTFSFTDNGLYGGTSQFIATVGTATSSITNPEGFVRGSATATGLQRVLAQGDGAGYRNQGIESAAGTYFFAVVGPAALDVPIILQGAAELHASGSSSVGVYETYGRNGGTQSNFGPVTCYGGREGGCGTFTYTQHYDLLASTGSIVGDVGFTSLHIYLIAQDGAASGFIDPVVSIDPAFADARQYHVVFAPGTGNPGAVPEPAVWATMLAGFGLAGGIARSARARSLRQVAS